ncbi:SitI3 family protein [Baaleninema simplex]|uniref:SitI3 family protein n=1 Tax=Baaleninema simplex TaxID=2862350 RepID=UPI00036D54B7|nr:SitI3 family protein [Baaleninema simplex]
MTIEYQLSISTDLKPENVVILSLDLIGVDYEVHDLIKSQKIILTTQDGILINAQYASKSWRQLLKEELNGLDANINVNFRLDKFKNREIQIKFLAIFTAHILNRVEGDCVFLSNHEIIILMRNSGEVSVNESLETWKLEYFNLLNQTFNSKKFNVL